MSLFNNLHRLHESMLLQVICFINYRSLGTSSSLDIAQWAAVAINVELSLILRRTTNFSVICDIVYCK